jgi:chromosome segregation protein
MADVIFNGTEKRKPLGMAEVTLTMADCEGPLKVDFNEVALTRRVFRDGHVSDNGFEKNGQRFEKN